MIRLETLPKKPILVTKGRHWSSKVSITRMVQPSCPLSACAGTSGAGIQFRKDMAPRLGGGDGKRLIMGNMSYIILYVKKIFFFRMCGGFRLAHRANARIL